MQYRVLISGTPRPYGIIAQYLPTAYYHLEPAPPAHDEERSRVWHEFAADKLGPAGRYLPGVYREVGPRLVTPWHIQLHWRRRSRRKAYGALLENCLL